MAWWSGTDEGKAGIEWEERLAGLLIEKGWHVVRTCDFSGKGNNRAPLLDGPSKCYILPDFLTFMPGRRPRWVEAKYKKHVEHTHIKNDRLEHGFDMPNFIDYLWIQLLTSIPVYIVLFEEETGDIIQGKMSDLRKDIRPVKNPPFEKRGMIYVPRSLFTPFEEVECPF